MLKSHPQSSDVKSPVVFAMFQIHIRRVEWQTNTHLPGPTTWNGMVYGLGLSTLNLTRITPRPSKPTELGKPQSGRSFRTWRRRIVAIFVAIFWQKKRDGPEMS
jgi:hypothetical protein